MWGAKAVPTGVIRPVTFPESWGTSQSHPQHQASVLRVKNLLFNKAVPSKTLPKMRWATSTLFTNLNSDSIAKESNPGKTKCYSTFLLLIKFPWFKGLKNKQEAIANVSVSFSLFSFLALSPPAAGWLINSPVPFCLFTSCRPKPFKQKKKSRPAEQEAHRGSPRPELHWVRGKLISYKRPNLLLYCGLLQSPCSHSIEAA